jgi:UPF0716 family protein affecting phage T7 exclusion
MKKCLQACLLVACLSFLLPDSASAQCSICTRTAQQLGEKPAKALNGAIIYLAATPLLLIGFIGYRWWKSNK